MRIEKSTTITLKFQPGLSIIKQYNEDSLKSLQKHNDVLQQAHKEVALCLKWVC